MYLNYLYIISSMERDSPLNHLQSNLQLYLKTLLKDKIFPELKSMIQCDESSLELVFSLSIQF